MGNGPELTAADLQAGDITIVYDDDSPDHSVMWVGGDKPLVHCTDGPGTSGIFQQSNYLYVDDDDAMDSDGEDEPIAEVYRCNSADIAQRARQIAQQFSTRSDNPAYRAVRQAGNKAFLRTRFSQNRLGGNGGIWGPEAFVRAVRAYFRAAHTLILSANEGVTCSQFLTYTYQAAGVWAHAQASPAHRQLITDAANDGLLGNMGLHGISPLEGLTRIGPAYYCLRPMRAQVEAVMPRAVQVNACIMAVDVLATRLHGGGSGFTYMGNLLGKPQEDD
jgi:hypothetical protein